MKITGLFLFLFPVLACAYPELCLPDHQAEYTAAYAEAKTAEDKFWEQSGVSCQDVGEFLDYFELRDPLAPTATEKEKCQWAGTAQGIALFSHQREAQCGVKKCRRAGSYIGRNVAKSFCGLWELYTSKPEERFLKDLERPVCQVSKEECVNEAEIYAGGKCREMKAKYPAVWQAVLQQTCF